MKIEIELPELPKGYEYTGEWRTPMVGEYYLNGSGHVVDRYWDDRRYIILRKILPPYEWPTINGEPMQGWGFAKDRNGSMYYYLGVPELTDRGWYGDRFLPCKYLELIGVPIPTITDWTKPVVNPYWKGGEK